MRVSCRHAAARGKMMARISRVEEVFSASKWAQCETQCVVERVRDLTGKQGE
jgi:hypothetical protein